MRVLVACEESQTVTKAFRLIGIEAYSCDLQDESGGYPQWHIKGDALTEAYSEAYDLIIAHPPCTYLSRAGARWMYPTAGNVCQERLRKAIIAREFFLDMLMAPANHVAVENPTPLKVVELPPHTQAIQPYEYGHPYSKRTLLWLKNLPKLTPTNVVTDFKPYLPSNTGGKSRGQSWSRGIAKTAKESSKTFEGIAKAMAEQWAEHVHKHL
jgi:hypothetical protein